MIRIARPSRVPAVLAKKVAALKKAGWSGNPDPKRSPFNAKIYGHKTVKSALIKAQHGKCCFCESKVTHIAFGHVEHFRPKAGVRQIPGGPLEMPGYYWLAYDWRNLLFCCELCNSRYKGNLFPLSNPRLRAKRPADELAREKPLFIDPASEEPTDFIGFRQEYPFAINGNARGNSTWRALGLDREQLAELRRDHLRVVQALRRVRDRDGPARDRREAAKLLEKFSSEEGQWSAMVKAALLP